MCQLGCISDELQDNDNTMTIQWHYNDNMLPQCVMTGLLTCRVRSLLHLCVNSLEPASMLLRVLCCARPDSNKLFQTLSEYVAIMFRHYVVLTKIKSSIIECIWILDGALKSRCYFTNEIQHHIHCYQSLLWIIKSENRACSIHIWHRWKENCGIIFLHRTGREKIGIMRVKNEKDAMS